MRDLLSVMESEPTNELSICAEEILFMVSKAHHWHLQSCSYEAHMALGGFYEGLQASGDAFIEAAMNERGLIESTGGTYTFSSFESSVCEIESFKQKLEHLHEVLPEIGLTNPLEDIITLCDSTLYKLKYLK